MKLLGLTQREDIWAPYNECRDALDSRWGKFCETIGVVPIPIPNAPRLTTSLLESVCFDGFILTGGAGPYGHERASGQAKTPRDFCEDMILDRAVRKNIPIVGVCRGMLKINLYFGGENVNVEGHRATRHRVRTYRENKKNSVRLVNSFHNLGISNSQIAESFCVTARSEDNQIEAMDHQSKPISGIMWHPEREAPFDDLDVQFFQRCFL